jgi:hypothetical protein
VSPSGTQILPSGFRRSPIETLKVDNNGVHELISPDIFPAEVGNALIVAER